MDHLYDPNLIRSRCEMQATILYTKFFSMSLSSYSYLQSICQSDELIGNVLSTDKTLNLHNVATARPMFKQKTLPWSSECVDYHVAKMTDAPKMWKLHAVNLSWGHAHNFIDTEAVDSNGLV